VSLDDHEPPVHRVSKAADRDRLLAEAMAHVEAQDAQYRLPMELQERQPLWKALLAILLLLTAGYLAAFPPALLRGTPASGVSTAERERGVRAALYLQAQQVEAFRLREGRLPTSLREVDVRLSDMEFVRSNSRVYQLVTHGPGGRVVYDSARPAPAVAAVAAPWGLEGGGS
jgi:hypothetical protein